jgi:hypothetical protein
MTTTENAPVASDAPLVPQPLSNEYDPNWHRWSLPARSGRPDPCDHTDLVQLWGHCTDFCDATDDPRTEGLTVAEHRGSWCTSQAIASIDGQDTDTSQRLALHVEVARPYLHGTYHRTAVWRSRHHEVQVQLTLSDGDDVLRVVNVDVGDALRLAAALTRAAAVADRLDRDFSDAKARRNGRPR